MKKFKFTLEAVNKHKLTIEKLQKAELKRAQAIMQQLLDEENRFKNAWIQTGESLDKILRSGENAVAALAEHDAYFRYLREALIKVKGKIIKAQEVIDEIQERLILTMKELKTYDKLRDEQYQAYLKEVQIEEEKIIGDMVSFKIISEI